MWTAADERSWMINSTLKSAGLNAFFLSFPSLWPCVCVAETLLDLSNEVLVWPRKHLMPHTHGGVWEPVLGMQPPPQIWAGLWRELLLSGLFFLLICLILVDWMSVGRWFVIIYVNYDYCAYNLMSGSCDEAEFRLPAPGNWDQMFVMVFVASRWCCWLCSLLLTEIYFKLLSLCSLNSW